MHTSAIPTTSPERTVTATRPRPILRDVGREAQSCLGCSLRRICMPIDVADPEAKVLFEKLVASRIRLRKGDVLFRAGERFTALYAIRVGSCKTVALADDGDEQVTGLHLPGEIIGVEGIGNDVHVAQAVALEDTEVCVLPFERIEALAQRDTGFRRRLYRLLSSAIVRERSLSLMLGTMRRAASRIVPARPVEPVSDARLFVDRLRAAHDARGDRQPFGAQAGDGQPPVLALRRGGPDRSARACDQAVRPHRPAALAGGELTR
jgi:CRP-like cAMP-binding protein